MPEVMVPGMNMEFTTARVLTMEWIEGERLRSASQQNPVKPSGKTTGRAVTAVTHSTGSRSGTYGESVVSLVPVAVSPGGVGMGHRSNPAEDLRLVEIGVRCSLEQMLEEGFYHADPHPGNLLKTQDGRLAYLDFGMMGEIDVGVRQALIRATLHLVNREYGALAEDFMALGLLPEGSNVAEIVPALTGKVGMEGVG
jgi:predicted unusual protein kinase regulating ubiquinone biosynthesis (AarF/ABC1/UbiB family)